MKKIFKRKLLLFIIIFLHSFFIKSAFSKSSIRILKDNIFINYFKLPFEISGLPTKEELITISPKNLIYKLSKVRIKTNLTIGSNKQILPTDISLDHFQLYVSGNKCKEKNLIIFNQDKSKSFIDLNKIDSYNFNQNCLKCNISKDYFYFENNININNKIQLSFVLGSLLKEEFKDISAEIGFKPNKDKNEPSINNFLTQLKFQKSISNRNFMLNFFKNKESIIDGQLIIGGFSDKYYQNSEKLKYFYISAENRNIEGWEFLLENAYYGKKYISRDNKVIISTKDMFIHPPFYMKKFLDIEFFNEYVNKSLCQLYNLENTSSYFYECDDRININKMKNFVFYPQNLNDPAEIVFSPEDLFYKFNNNKYLFLMEFNDNASNWIFCLLFIMKYQPIFDIDNKIISILNNIDEDFLYNKRSQKNKLNANERNINYKKEILISFLIIALLLTIFILLKIMTKYYKKRNPKEIKESQYLEFRDMSNYYKDS